MRKFIVDGVGLPMPSTDLAVRAVDLDDRHPSLSEVTGQTRPVGAGPLDPDGLKRPEGDQERQQPAIADRCGRERVRAQDSTEGVAGSGDVDVGVSVHASDDSDGT